MIDEGFVRVENEMYATVPAPEVTLTFAELVHSIVHRSNDVGLEGYKVYRTEVAVVRNPEGVEPPWRTELRLFVSRVLPEQTPSPTPISQPREINAER